MTQFPVLQDCVFTGGTSVNYKAGNIEKYWYKIQTKKISFLLASQAVRSRECTIVSKLEFRGGFARRERGNMKSFTHPD